MKKRKRIHAYKLMVGNNNHILCIALIFTDVEETDHLYLLSSNLKTAHAKNVKAFFKLMFPSRKYPNDEYL